jgi:hypothetical protein
MFIIITCNILKLIIKPLNRRQKKGIRKQVEINLDVLSINLTVRIYSIIAITKILEVKSNEKNTTLLNKYRKVKALPITINN